jgi:hypothetical protein
MENVYFQVHGIAGFRLEDLGSVSSVTTLHIVTYKAVARQGPRNKQRDNGRCYAILVRWAVVLDAFLDNGSVNTFSRQLGRRSVAYAVRA